MWHPTARRIDPDRRPRVVRRIGPAVAGFESRLLLSGTTAGAGVISGMA